MSALDQLRAQNSRTVHLMLVGEEAVSVPPGTPDAIPFQLVRVSAHDIRQDIVYAALGRDGYVRYATWYNAEAQRSLRAAQAVNRPDAPAPFDDSLPEDAHWRAHSVALEEAITTEVLTRGMLDPTYQESQHVLGPYAPALMTQLIQWGRTPEPWHPPVPLADDATPAQLHEAQVNDDAGKLLSAPSVPP